MDEETRTLRKFWNDAYSGYDGAVFTKEDCTFGGDLDEALKFMGDNCTSIVDYGCGSGAMLFNVAFYGDKVEKLCGLDVSESGVKFAAESAVKTGIDKLSFICGGAEKLDELPFVDGIICSNVLDVIKEDEADEILDRFYKKLPIGGYLLLKINFYLDENYLSRVAMKEGEKNYYYYNGVLRAHNMTTDEWMKKLDKFTLVKQYSFKRAETLPPDRLFLLKK